MIITINQAQIEQAITNYVNSKMVIADTQRLDIDLKATRGPEGYTCVIELVDIDAPRSAAPAEEARPSIRETVRQARQEPAAETPMTEVVGDLEAEQETAAEPEVSNTPAPAPARKGNSIFAKHTKISNPAPAEAATEEPAAETEEA